MARRRLFTIIQQSIGRDFHIRDLFSFGEPSFVAPLMNMPDLIQEFIKSPTIQLWAYYCWLHIVVTQSQMVSKPDKKKNLIKMVEVYLNKLRAV